MAAIENSSNGQATKGRSKKPVPRVDLTAMVDLAFLLITFFMLTTSLAKKNALELAKPVPVEEPIDFAQWPASRTMTILLGNNDQVCYYLGEAKNAQMRSLKLAFIKSQILTAKREVASVHDNEREKRLLVIIKPTSKSIYKNFVDILDEMQVNGVETYAVDDKQLLPEEQNFMKSRGI